VGVEVVEMEGVGRLMPSRVCCTPPTESPVFPTVFTASRVENTTTTPA
jgi:hypothetical protein